MEFCGCGDLAQKVDRYKKRKQHVDEVREALAAAAPPLLLLTHRHYAAIAALPTASATAPFAGPRTTHPAVRPYLTATPPHTHPHPAARDLGVPDSAGGRAQGPPRKEYYSPRYQDGQLLPQRRWCVLWI